MAILELERQNRAVKEASGASLFGLDASLWPAWWLDAVTLLEYHHNLQRNAQLS